jgi:hypothetical protein
MTLSLSRKDIVGLVIECAVRDGGGNQENDSLLSSSVQEISQLMNKSSLHHRDKKKSSDSLSGQVKEQKKS